MPDRVVQLSPREREILTLVGAGQSYKEIARQLGISPRTVETHVTRAIATLGARNRTDAVRLFETASVESRKGPPAIAAPAVSMEPMLPDRSLAARLWRRLPILRNGRLNNELSIAERLGWIVAGATAIIILFAQLAAGLRVAEEVALGLGL